MSDESEDQAKRDEFHHALDALVQLGWLHSWARHGERYAYHFTDKGRERARWLRTIDRELQAGERAMTNVMAICCTAHADEVGDSTE